jgi:phage recombination protein Bet
MKELEKTQDKSTKALKEHEKKIDEFIKTFLVHENLDDSEIKKFREIAVELNLDPFNKEIYAIPYNTTVYINGKPVKKRTLSIVTGYEVYLRRADSHPAFEGYKTELNGKVNDPEFSCTITVYRNDRKYPIIHTAYFQEFAGRTSDGNLTKFWLKPRFMIEKVTIGQGLRRAFPNDFSKMPYVKEEMDSNIRDVTPKKEDETPTMIETDKLVDELKELKNELNELNPPDKKFEFEKTVDELEKKKNEKMKEKMGAAKTPVKKEVEFNPAEAMDEILTRARKLTNFLSKEQITHYQQLAISKDYSSEKHDEELQFLTQLESDSKDLSQEVNK